MPQSSPCRTVPLRPQAALYAREAAAYPSLPASPTHAALILQVVFLSKEAKVGRLSIDNWLNPPVADINAADAAGAANAADAAEPYWNQNQTTPN